MADEQTQAPVAGAENATKQPTKLYVYYYSNPDGATKDERCHTILTDKPFSVIPWHIHKEAPDENMVDPVWDNNLNNGLGAWKENSGTAQGQILAEATQAIADLKTKGKELDQANNKVDQAVKAMQQVQAQSAQQNLAMMKSFTEQTKNTNKMLATMQQTLAMVVKADKNATTPTESTTPAADTKPAEPKTDAPQAGDQTTDKKENGGN